MISLTSPHSCPLQTEALPSVCNEDLTTASILSKHPTHLVQDPDPLVEDQTSADQTGHPSSSVHAVVNLSSAEPNPPAQCR